MNYHLVLQYRGDSLEDYDAMIALEDELIARLETTARVDGHDMGCGERNIFILTPDPRRTFRQLQPVLERAASLDGVVAAYRVLDTERYTVIWPEDFTKEFRVA